MDGDSMRTNRRTTSFLKQKSYMLAAVLMLVAAFGMTGVYVAEEKAKKQEQEQVVLEEQQKQERMAQVQEIEKDTAVENKVENDDFLDDPNIVSKSDEEIEEEANKEEEATELEETEVKAEVEEETQTEEIQETVSNHVEKSLQFDGATEMEWPLQGNVIMNYSMEQTIYFATLDQYKYNPALIIQGKVNDQVLSVADGKITNIETNMETGCTVTVELGDGYSAIYGQLKEVPFAVDDYVKAGDIIGYISEPTKYYSVEGANLYFQMTKDGESIDPMGFLQ